jgi:acyl-CoA dehydrogenase
MSFTVALPGEHDDLRRAVRSLCADFAHETRSRVDSAATHPENVVGALTADGGLSVLAEGVLVLSGCY